MDISGIRAWMSDHVFLSVGIAVVATALIILLARDTFKQFYLRLYQLSVLSGVGLSATCLYLGAAGGDRNILVVGGAMLMSTLIGVFSAWRIHHDIVGRPGSHHSAPAAPGKAG